MANSYDPRGGSYPSKHAGKKEEEENATPSGTIPEIKKWVGDDTERAQRALDAENANEKPRATLVEYLEGKLNG
jgi:hypothetical protein